MVAVRVGVKVAFGSGVGVEVGGVPVTVGVSVKKDVLVTVGESVGVTAGPLNRRRTMVVYGLFE